MTIQDGIILGIDPGTLLLGFGVIAVRGGKPHFLDMGVLDLRREGDHFHKLAVIAEEIAGIMDKYSPDALAIESAFYARDAQVIQKLGRVQGIVISEAVRRGMSVAEYAPRKAKIAVTGNGAASKSQVAAMICNQLNIRQMPEHKDATDALAIALCHYYESVSPIPSAGKGGDSWKRFIEANPDRVK